MLLPEPRMIVPETADDVTMMTADRRYWTDPVWRRNVIEFLRYFKSIEAEVNSRKTDNGSGSIFPAR